MMAEDLLNNKRILIVDDEPDVLDTLESLLPMCEVVKATRFDTAKELLESEYFDLAVLDIMGVDGYKLLEIAGRRSVIPVMLTAHALSPDDTVRSFKAGAAYFVPKEKMSGIATYLNDVLEAKDKGKSFWWRWLDRFAAYYDRTFGPQWKQVDEEFWNKFQWWQ
jgi:DNA-binding NtrC family response regulator